MIVYLGNQKINQLYSGDKEVLAPTNEESINFFTAEYLLVAQGGTGGFNTDTGIRGNGGGGAGGLLSGSMNFTYGETYNIVIDDGDGDSTFAGMTASAGGRGGTAGQGQGGSGGSGGGSAAGVFTGGAGTVGQGFKGGDCSSASDGGGGGGGANEPGAGGNSGAGGFGKQSSISGTLDWYAGGGSGGFRSGGGTWFYGQQASGSTAASYGGGSRANVGSALPAGEGVCYIRYRGPQKAEGGFTYADGDFIVHRFNTSLNTQQPFIVESKIQ
jgi:hypothetical protein